MEIKRKRLNWCLILQFFTSDDVKNRFYLYSLEHKKVKSRNRLVHNFLLHWFGKEWCSVWLNPRFYNENVFVRELVHLTSVECGSLVADLESEIPF